MSRGLLLQHPVLRRGPSGCTRRARLRREEDARAAQVMYVCIVCLATWSSSTAAASATPSSLSPAVSLKLLICAKQWFHIIALTSYLFASLSWKT